MSGYELLDDLYAYNDWANQKVIDLCSELSDRELDQPREIGFGTLRATVFHIWAAENIWMERWMGMPWRPFPTDPDGASLSEIANGLQKVAARRRSLIELNRGNRWSETIDFQDSKKHDYQQKLIHLLLHVAVHGIHHRAQALQYLKQFGQTVVAGLDYCFYRLAASTVPQATESVKSMREYGLEIATTQTPDPDYDRHLIDVIYRYHSWATDEVLTMCDGVSVSSLDHDFDMGSGSIRKTLLHLLDAETWWNHNWIKKPIPFPHSDDDTSLAEIRERLTGAAGERFEILEKLDSESAMEIVVVHPGGPPTAFRVGESVLHLALHGVHHRAQLINMVRRSEGKIKNIDLIYWPAVD